MYFQIGTRRRVWQMELVTSAIVQEEAEPETHEVLSTDLGFQRYEPEYDDKR